MSTLARSCSLAIALSFLLTARANAGVPASLCVQGYLESTTTHAPITGAVSFRVTIWDAATNGTQVWPTGGSGFLVINVPVTNGLFAVVVGDANTALTPAAFGNPDGTTNEGPQPRWIEFATDADTNGTFDPMSPRVALHTAPFAHRVGFVGNAELTDNVELGSASPPAAGSLKAFNGASSQPAINVDSNTFFGGPWIRLRDPAGYTRAEVMGAAAGSSIVPSSALRLYGENGTPGVNIEGGLNDSTPYGGGINLYNGNGIATSFFGGGRVNDCGRLYLADGTSQNAVVTLDAVGKAPNGGGRVSLSNGQSPNAETVRVHGHPLTLQSNGNQGRGGGIAVLSDDGLAGAEFYINTNGVPVMHMYNSAVGFAQETVSLSANTFGGGRIRLQDNSTNQAVIISAGEHKIQMFNGQSPNQETITLNGNGIGPGGSRMTMRNAIGHATVFLDANDLAGGGAELALQRSDGSYGIVLDTESGTPSQHPAKLYMAAPGNAYTVFLSSGDQASRGASLHLYNDGTPNQETIVLSGSDPVTSGGSIEIRNNGSTPLIEMLADDPDVPNNDDARICVRGKINTRLLTLNGSGVCNQPALVSIDGASGNACFHGNVSAASFNPVGGCDLAEHFDHADPAAVQPGMVMVIDAEKPGRLRLSTRAYDTAVAGIISGAGGLQPGVVLGNAHPEQRDLSRPVPPRAKNQPSRETPDGVNAAPQNSPPDMNVAARESANLPLALSGRVYCYVDASREAVAVGDLLTTSETPGYAMKVSDRNRAFGAVIGKAMQPLKKGQQGLILVLVALQ